MVLLSGAQRSAFQVLRMSGGTGSRVPPDDGHTVRTSNRKHTHQREWYLKVCSSLAIRLQKHANNQQIAASSVKNLNVDYCW